MNKPSLPSFEQCCGCRLCVDVCARHAIDCIENKNGFYEIVIDENKCVKCGMCEKKCPALNPVVRNDKAEPFWGWSLDDSLREKSSSGAAFAQLASDFIKNHKGVVIGATLENGLTVSHIAIERLEDIHLLQGSKYLQSNTTGIYKTALSHLKNGRSVLFSGTPCQIAAIKKMADGQEFSQNLYTVEVVCHGIPSFHFHRIGLQLNNASGVENFRTKKNGGWGSCRISYNFKEANSTPSPEFGDFFFKSFFNDFFLRPSCYDCQYAQANRVADLSIADGWGAERAGFEEDSLRKGVSLILANTTKGHDLIKSDLMFIQKANWLDFLDKNPCTIMNLSYLKSLSFSKWISFIQKYLPHKLAIYIFSCTAPKKGWGLVSKFFVVPLLKRK